MRTSKTIIALFAILVSAALVAGPRVAAAHCDALDGPVAKAALQALESGDFAAVQIWVGSEEEAELRRVYRQAAAVRRAGGEARELADRYFVETAVRLHRAAEGMPYTGLQPAGLELPPDIRAGDAAVESGDAGPVLAVLQEALEARTREWFDRAVAARTGRDESVAAGREWVDAYVKYIVYVHGVYQKIQSPPAHGVGE